jgi:hypothetical protein
VAQADEEATMKALGAHYADARRIGRATEGAPAISRR